MELDTEIFVDLAPHCASVSVGKKAIWGDFVKVMVEVEHASLVAKILKKDLRENKMHKRLHDV